MERLSLPLLIFCSLFLAGCPKGDDPAPIKDDRVPVPGRISIYFLPDSSIIECEKPFEIEKIKFITFKGDHDRCAQKYPPGGQVRIPFASSFEIDVSYYKDIKSISLGMKVINLYKGYDGSEVKLYNFDDKIIEQVHATQGTDVAFDKNLEDLRKIVITGRGEVTDLRSISIVGNR